MKTPDSLKKNALIIFILLIFFCLGISVIKAQQSVSPHLAVFPEKFELKLQRGQHLEDEIVISNKSNVALPINTRVLNFTAEEQTGTIQFYGGDAEGQGIDEISFNPRKWITLKKPNFILDPGENEKVNVSIDTPQNAEPGGHYAVILFEPELPSFYFKEGQPRAIPVIGVLFLLSVNVEGLNRIGEQMTVVEFGIPEKFHLKKLENLLANLSGAITEARAAEKESMTIVETGNLPFTLRIKNSDIYHIKPEGKLEIFNSSGKKVGETEIKETTILPGKTRNFPVEFRTELPKKLERYLPRLISSFISKNLLVGKYQASLLLTTGSDTMEKSIEFWVFPWKIILSTVVVLCLLTLFVVKYRKRITAAILVLFWGKPRTS
jgi:hypothetical protein